MFDLFRSREKAVRYLLGALLMLVAISMVVTLVPGFGSGSIGGRNESVIAKIGSDELTAPEVRVFIQRQIQGHTIQAEMAQFYVPVVVQNMVAERATAYEATRVGFRINNQELANNIVAQIPQLMEGGKFVGNEVYAAYLSQMNMTIPQFEANFRQQMLLTRLENMVLEGIVVTPAEVEDAYKKKNDKIKLNLVGITADKYKSQVTVTPAEMQDYYNKHKSAYNKPEARSFVLFAVEDQKMAEQVKPDEAALRRMYDSQKDRYRVDERVKIRHILVMTQDKPKEEVEKLRKKAEDLLKQVKAGADFGELAKKNSDDPGSKEKGGDLGFVVKGQTVPEFEKTAFALKPGEISNLVQTTYGYHILKCEGRENARIKPFDEVRNELAAEMSREQVGELTLKAANEIRAALVKSVAEAEKVAQKYGIAAVHADKAGRGDPIPEVGANPDFQDSAYRLPKDGVTAVISVGPKLVVARVTELLAPRPMEFTDAQAMIKPALEGEKLQALVVEKVKEFQEKLKASNNDLAVAAKSMGLEMKSPAAFARDGQVEGIGAATGLPDAFDKNVGDMGGPLRAGGGTYFYKVTEKIPADLTALAAQRDQLLQALKQRRMRERKDLFNDGLVNELVKEKKLKLNEDNIKRLVTSYRPS
jgi:peptidyl-prolyl cis-trans isomerase D